MIAILALFVALGGSAYAFKLGKNSVKTKNIKAQAVTTEKLADAGVTRAKLAAGAVGAGSLGKVVVRLSSYKPLNDGGSAIPEAHCAPGEQALSGGAGAQASPGIFIASSRPTATGYITDGVTVPDGWSVQLENPAGGAGNTQAVAYVLCLQ